MAFSLPWSNLPIALRQPHLSSPFSASMGIAQSCLTGLILPYTPGQLCEYLSLCSNKIGNVPVLQRQKRQDFLNSASLNCPALNVDASSPNPMKLTPNSEEKHLTSTCFQSCNHLTFITAQSQIFNNKTTASHETTSAASPTSKRHLSKKPPRLTMGRDISQDTQPCGWKAELGDENCLL